MTKSVYASDVCKRLRCGFPPRFVSLLQLPLYFVLAFWTAARTQRLSVKLKVVGVFIVVPLALVLYIPATVVVSIAVGIRIAYSTSTSSFGGLCSFWPAWSDTSHAIQDFKDYVFTSLPATLRASRTEPCATPADVSVLGLLGMLLLLPVGIVVDGVVIALYASVFLLPVLLWYGSAVEHVYGAPWRDRTRAWWRVGVV